VGDAARHLAESAELRRLDGLFLGSLELRVGRPEIGVELGVADGDPRLLGHGAGEPNLLGAERVRLRMQIPTMPQAASPRMTGAVSTARIPSVLNRASGLRLPFTRRSAGRSPVHTGVRISAVFPVDSSPYMRTSELARLADNPRART
jgi:hypothetical protein